MDPRTFTIMDGSTGGLSGETVVVCVLLGLVLLAVAVRFLRRALAPMRAYLGAAAALAVVALASASSLVLLTAALVAR